MATTSYWYPFELVLFEHPKTVRAVQMLGIGSRECFLGHLMHLWAFAMMYAPDGYLDGYTEEDIALAANWTGDAHGFTEALLFCGVGGRVGFLEAVEDGGYYLHDWREYGGKLHLQRQAEADRKRTKRGQEPDIPRTSPGHPPDIRRTADVEESRAEDRTNKPTKKRRAARDVEDGLSEEDRYRNLVSPPLPHQEP